MCGYVESRITVRDGVRGRRGEPAGIGLDFTKGLPEGEMVGGETSLTRGMRNVGSSSGGYIHVMDKGDQKRGRYGVCVGLCTCKQWKQKSL